MNAIIDYRVGNIRSVERGFKRAGIETVVTNDAALIEQADLLILPGVGAFGDAMQDLRDRNLIPLIEKHVKSNKLLLGICLGMQLLYEESDEFGYHEGLRLLTGKVGRLAPGKKIPHMGWNDLIPAKDDPIMQGTVAGDQVYFVHSYAAPMTDDVIAYTVYGERIPAIVRKNRVIGMQFHPEKSGNVGLELLKAIKEVYL
ncbi:MAG: imidazole glycerol phosphate synthase subunit HisH [Acholeplasmataceae bacterium]